MTRRTAQLLTAALAASAFALPLAGPAAARGERQAPAGTCVSALASTVDFDGDGKRDMAIGAPSATIGGKGGAGAVMVVYGGASGLGTRIRLRSQDSPDVQDSAQTGDGFGSSLATADFDCDGYTDLAVGVPGEDNLGSADVGAVNLLYGGPEGLAGDPTAPFFTFDDSPGEPGTRIGQALVALDSWDEAGGVPGSDGRPDLAVGAPGANGFEGTGGTVFLLAGLFIDREAATGSSRRIEPNVPDGSDAGAALAAADLDDDEIDDLVIGIPLADVLTKDGLVPDAGAIAIAFNGLEGSSVWLAGDELPGPPRAGDHLGAAVAAGDITGDGLADVVAGIPDRNQGATDAGAILIVRSSVALGGPDTTQRVIIHQGTTGIEGDAGSGDRFGAALAIGNLGKGSRADIAVGVPGETVGGIAGAGAVAVLYSGVFSFGVSDERWSSSSPGVADGPEAGDAFGSVLSIAERGGGSPADLAIGVPLEDLGSTQNAGGVHVLFGDGPDGLTATDARWFTRGSLGTGTLVGRARLGFSTR